MCIYLFMSWIQVTSNVILSNVIPTNNLLLNSYFENLIVRLHGLYVLKMHASFYNNQMLITIRFIISFFMYYFKLQKL